MDVTLREQTPGAEEKGEIHRGDGGGFEVEVARDSLQLLLSA